ncbi:MAG TPA: hypothetical protein PKZ41_01795 [Candidatus Omnitrophota bacterium]|nr:hypothetical protein [Candidatus Omnitrophota bacterium]
MRIYAILISFFTAIVCSLSPFCFSQELKNSALTMRAQVISVDPADRILTVRTAGRPDSGRDEEMTLDVPENTVVVLEGEVIELYDLMPGDDVTIEYSPADGGDMTVSSILLEIEGVEEEEIDVEVSE